MNQYWGRVEFLAIGKVESSNLELVEALEILEALKQAANFSYPSVHIFSDAQATVGWICNPSTIPLLSILFLQKKCMRLFMDQVNVLIANFEGKTCKMNTQCQGGWGLGPVETPPILKSDSQLMVVI